MSTSKNHPNIDSSIQTLHDIQREIMNTTQFITDCTNMDLKTTQKNVATTGKKQLQNWKIKEISIFTENQPKAILRVKHKPVQSHRNSDHEEDHNDHVKNCKVWMNSPLHARYNGKWHKLSDLASVPDYIILHVCTNLLFIRTLGYISKSLDTSNYLFSDNAVFSVFSDEKEKHNAAFRVHHVYELLEKDPSLSFEVSFENKKMISSTQLSLIKDEKKNQYVWVAKKDKQDPKILNSLAQDPVDLPEEVDYLEHSFIDDTKVKNRCLHPSSVFNLRYILSIE